MYTSKQQDNMLILSLSNGTCVNVSTRDKMKYVK